MRPRFRKKNNRYLEALAIEQTFVKKWFKALRDTKYKKFYQELKIFFYEHRTYTQIEKITKCFNKIKRNLKKTKHPK